ncbi:MAG: hypothetical protein NVS9B12_02660 [Vulcanimicrobiaceae bacterium]
MFKKSLLPALAIAALLGSTVAAGAADKMDGGHMKGHMMGHMAMTGPEHGMPVGNNGEGRAYTGAPDLQATISLVIAGGAPGNFSVVKAISAMAGPAIAKAEVAKLTKQYGAAKVGSFVAVQNFAVNDAVKIATAAGVKLPSPMLKGGTLAKRVVGLGLINGTYYEGTQLDHLVTHAIHEHVMNDIDAKFGVSADANYHRIANQAHYDLAQALGVTSVKLAEFH